MAKMGEKLPFLRQNLGCHFFFGWDFNQKPAGPYRVCGVGNAILGSEPRVVHTGGGDTRSHLQYHATHIFTHTKRQSVPNYKAHRRQRVRNFTLCKTVFCEGGGHPPLPEIHPVRFGYPSRKSPDC